MPHGGEIHLPMAPRKFHFITVYIEVELGNICLEGRWQSWQLFALGSVVHQRIRRIYQIFEGCFSAGFKLHLETARATQTGNHRRSERVNPALGILVQAFLTCAMTSSMVCSPRSSHGFRMTVSSLRAWLLPPHGGLLPATLHIFYGRLLHQVVYSTFRYDAGALQCSSFG